MTRLIVAKTDDGSRIVSLYSIHSDPLYGSACMLPVSSQRMGHECRRSEYFITCGRDPSVRLYDRRYIRDWKRDSKPLQLYAPHNLVCKL